MLKFYEFFFFLPFLKIIIATGRKVRNFTEMQ